MPADHTLTRDEARARARLISDVSYDVDLDLAGDEPTFPSRTRLRFSCAEPGASTFVDLAASSVERVVLNGEEVPAGAVGAGRISLDGLAEDNVVEVTARCAYERTGVGLHRFRDPVDGHVYLHTQFEPFDAHRVYACFDQPDLKAPFTLSVRAPSAWQVVGNSPAVARDDAGEGLTRWRFAPTLAISTYLTALVAGPFHAVHDRHGDVDLAVYCRASLAEHLDAEEIFTITRQGLDYFTGAFQLPYPFGGGDDGRHKYDQLFVPEFNFGAMENPGSVTFSEAYVFRSKVTDAARQSRAGTILHEMAHMWFGDLVTMRWWDDLWLNESFATYMGNRALAEATRFTDAWAAFANDTKAWALAQDQLPTTHPVAADIPDTDAVRTNFDGITYAKGASVLKQLVAWVGDEGFFSGLRDYFRRHAYGNATLADFLTALEKTSGRALADWSSEWLETTGVATLRAEAEADDGRYGRVTIRQEATPEHPTLRSHRVAVGCYELSDAGLTRSRRVELDVVGASTDVPDLAGVPEPDLLLVNDDDLTFAKVRLDERSLATLTGHLGALGAPLARTLAWGGAWDMTRDAELAARRWVRLVAEHAGEESDLSVLQRLFARARAAADRYGAPGNRAAARAELAGAARAELAGAAPGSDRQLAVLRHLADVGDGEAHVAFLVGLLDGTVELTGLTVDTELRWHLLGRLAADGAADEERIAAELERDPTDMGLRRAAAARASRPAPGAKEHAWRALLGDRTLPLATLRALAGGFWQYGQDELLMPYAERYAEGLAAAWDDRVIEEAISLTGGLYPSTIVHERILEIADAVLADAALPAPARRVVTEQRDATARALRARAADRSA